MREGGVFMRLVLGTGVVSTVWVRLVGFRLLYVSRLAEDTSSVGLDGFRWALFILGK